jgi:hypothetical protein
MENTIVYVVTYRNDGDYEIHGVFTKKEKAEKFMQIHNMTRGYNIEEFILDDMSDSDYR